MCCVVALIFVLRLLYFCWATVQNRNTWVIFFFNVHYLQYFFMVI